MYPYLLIGGTFGCLLLAIVLLAAELAWIWKDPNTTDAGRDCSAAGVKH